eukprot:15442212-Alexandrium_andersonii.AAC.1
MEPLPGMSAGQLRVALMIALPRFYPVDRILLDQQFSCLTDLEGCEAIEIAGLEDHEGQGVIERTIRSVKTLLAKNPSKDATSGVYCDRALWCHEMCTTLNMRPVLHATWGEVIPAGLQAGVYPPEVIALYNTARAQTSAKLAEKDKTHSRPVFQKGDQVLYYKENSFGK